jgi:hypothetical protein
MSFQFVLDNAQQASVNRRPVVSQTQTRSGIIRSVKRDLDFWTIEAQLPEGIRWSVNRQAINDMENLDRYTTEFIGFRNSGLDYFYGYQGDQPNPENIRGTVYGTNTEIILSSGITITSGFIFRKGDIFQIGTTGAVYQVTADVRETVGTYDLLIGQAARFKVKCVQFPQWRMVDYDQVGWNSSFVFQEILD